MGKKAGVGFKGKGQIGGVSVKDLRCRCSPGTLANSKERAGPSGPVCGMQAAEILSQQHVWKHALGLSTLLLDPWQIDREAAGPPCTLLTRLVPRPRCEHSERLQLASAQRASASWPGLC